MRPFIVCAAAAFALLLSPSFAQDAPPAPETPPKSDAPRRTLGQALAELRDAPAGDHARLVAALVAAKPSPGDIRKAFDAGLPPPATQAGWTVQSAVDANGTARPYHLYVPAKVAEARAPAPLLLDLHGGVGRPEFIEDDQFARFRDDWVETADELGMVLALPLGRADCAWWTESGVAHVRATVRDAKRHAPVDADRVICTGFSDGGSGCWHLALQTPEPFAGLMPMNGQPGVATHYSPYQHYLTNARLTPLFVAMTQDDPLYPATTVLPHVQGLFEVGASARLVSYPTGGHSPSYAEDQMPAFRSFLRTVRRDALPDRVRFSASDPAVGAVRWIAIEELGSSSLDGELSAEPQVLSRPGRVVLGFEIARGAERPGVGVGRVRPESAASAMGLTEGDLIVRVNDTDVPDTDALRAVLGETPWGTTVRVTVERDGADGPVELTTDLPPFTPETLYPREHPTGVVEVRKSGNTVALTSSGVRRLRLFLDPRHFDLGKEVVVTVDGKEIARAKPEASVERLLTGFAREADPSRLFAAEMVVDLSAAGK